MNILVIQGHPDAGQRHFCHALAEAYAEGARSAGHGVRLIDVGTLDFPLLRSKAQWEGGALPEALAPAQQHITWARHIVIFFPLWMGGMPALLKGFFEQVARPGFAIAHAEGPALFKKLLSGRSARIVVTMGMPAIVYRWYFRAHSLKALERNILGFAGIAPIHETLVGMIDGMDDAQHAKWLRKLKALGQRGD